MVKRTWEAEKACTARRAAKYGAMMDTALANFDFDDFQRVYKKGFNTFTAKQRGAYMAKYCKARKAAKFIAKENDFEFTK